MPIEMTTPFNMRMAIPYFMLAAIAVSVVLYVSIRGVGSNADVLGLSPINTGIGDPLMTWKVYALVIAAHLVFQFAAMLLSQNSCRTDIKDDAIRGGIHLAIVSVFFIPILILFDRFVLRSFLINANSMMTAFTVLVVMPVVIWGFSLLSSVLTFLMKNDDDVKDKCP